MGWILAARLLMVFILAVGEMFLLRSMEGRRSGVWKLLLCQLLARSKYLTTASLLVMDGLVNLRSRMRGVSSRFPRNEMDKCLSGVVLQEPQNPPTTHTCPHRIGFASTQQMEGSIKHEIYSATVVAWNEPLDADGS